MQMIINDEVRTNKYIEKIKRLKDMNYIEKWKLMITSKLVTCGICPISPPHMQNFALCMAAQHSSMVPLSMTISVLVRIC